MMVMVLSLRTVHPQRLRIVEASRGLRELRRGHTSRHTFGLLHVFDGPLDRAVHFLFNLMQGAPTIQFVLKHFVSLKELLKLVRKLKILLRYHAHVPGHLGDLALLLVRLGL